MNRTEKEMSTGEYFSYLSNKDYDMFDEMVRPRIETFPREWSEYFLCYREGKDSSYCFSNLEPDTFCKDKVRID